MRIFLAILILIFSLKSWTNAEEVKNFEIEGMTVGESLLKYMDKSEILDKINSKKSYHYPNNAFVVFGYYSNNFKIYDDVGVVIKPKDSNFIIHALEGTIYYRENKCNKKQEEISNDLKNFLEPDTYKFSESPNQNFIMDKTGNSKVKYLDFYFNDSSAIRVICWVLSESFKLKENNIDRLVVAANSALFMKWINNNMKN